MGESPGRHGRRYCRQFAPSQTGRLPAAGRRAVGLVVVGLTLLYAGLMTYGSWNYLARLRTLGVEAEDIPIQRWILTLCLPIGFALLFVRLLGMGWRVLTGRSVGYELADETEEAIREFGGDGRPDVPAAPPR